MWLSIKEENMYVSNEEPDYIPGAPISVTIADVRRRIPHFHRGAFEFIYCLSGSVDVTVAHEHMMLKKGETVLIEHENTHSLTSAEANLLLFIHIDINGCGHDPEEIRYLYFSCATALCKRHQEPYLQKINDILLATAYLYASHAEEPFEQYMTMAHLLVDILVDQFTWFAIEAFTSDENKVFKSRLNDTLAYLQRHYREKITLSRLAKKEYINENYFSQFLKRTSFHSFTRMLGYIRCFEAEKLLLTTDMPVQAISDACGFSSKKYFHKHFKFFWETTPLQHRKACQRKLEEPNAVEYLPPHEALPLIENEICQNLISRLLK